VIFALPTLFKDLQLHKLHKIALVAFFDWLQLHKIALVALPLITVKE
jgi:hypothetical protein